MSARDKLLHWIWGAGLPDPEAQALADEILGDHAHELATRQRNWDAEAEGYTDPQMAVYAVADLIDPEADDEGESAGPVRPVSGEETST